MKQEKQSLTCHQLILSAALTAQFMFVALLLGACAGQESYGPSDTLHDHIRLTASTAGGAADGTIALTTRSTGTTRSTADAVTDGSGQQNAGAFAQGQTFTAVFTEGSSVSSTRYTTGAAQSGSPQYNECTPMAQPLFTAAEAKVHAYYPATVSPLTRSFSVEQDQSQTAAGLAGYRRSDLMYAPEISIPRTTSTGRFTFQHLLSKVTVSLAAPTDPVARITAVRLVGGWRTIALQADIYDHNAAPTEALGSHRSLTDHASLSDALVESNSGTNQITLYADATGTDGALRVSAIVPPQTIAAGRNFIEVDVALSGTGSQTFSYALGADAALQPGMAYENATALRVAQATATVTLADTPWTEHQEAAEPLRQVVTFHTAGASFNMRFVKGGTYTQTDGQTAYRGLANGATGDLADYYMAETEVTNALWQSVMGSKPAVRLQPATKYDTGDGQSTDADDCPVSFVTPNEIINQFLPKLNALVAAQLPEGGWYFALPSETQWEWAAHGGTAKETTAYPGGGDIDALGWYSTTNSTYNANAYGTTHPVGQKTANSLGLYDMAGNVQEILSTTNGDYYRTRGGGFWNSAAACMITYNSGQLPSGSRANDKGLRLALVRSGAAPAPRATIATTDPIGTTATYSHNGASNTEGSVVTATLDPGTYRFEVYGAQGGGGGDSNSAGGGTLLQGTGGRGGYVSAVYTVANATTPFYICCGGMGSDYNPKAKAYANGGYNGGGRGTWDHSDSSNKEVTNGELENAAGGGGATHVAVVTERGELKQYASYKAEVLLVAGGGGGAGSFVNSSTTSWAAKSTPGVGGCGLNELETPAGISYWNQAGPNTLTSPWTDADNFGRGTDGYYYTGGNNHAGQGGNGGGYYGGRSTSQQNGTYGSANYPYPVGGAGGSGHVNTAPADANVTYVSASGRDGANVGPGRVVITKLSN